jgi:hypothetical protein
MATLSGGMPARTEPDTAIVITVMNRANLDNFRNRFAIASV